MCGFAFMMRTFYDLCDFMSRVFVFMAVALLLGGLAGCIYEGNEPEYSLAVGEPLPDVRVELLDGAVFDVRALYDTKIENLLIVFFNTDCPDCQRDLPQIQSLYDDIQQDEMLSRNTCLVCIAREEAAPQVRDYWTAHRFTMPVSSQSDRRVYNMFASAGIPRVYLASVSTWTIIEAWSPELISKASILGALREEKSY